MPAPQKRPGFISDADAEKFFGAAPPVQDFISDADAEKFFAAAPPENPGMALAPAFDYVAKASTPYVEGLGQIALDTVNPMAYARGAVGAAKTLYKGATNPSGLLGDFIAAAKATKEAAATPEGMGRMAGELTGMALMPGALERAPEVVANVGRGVARGGAKLVGTGLKTGRTVGVSQERIASELLKEGRPVTAAGIRDAAAKAGRVSEIVEDWVRGQVAKGKTDIIGPAAEGISSLDAAANALPLSSNAGFGSIGAAGGAAYLIPGGPLVKGAVAAQSFPLVRRAEGFAAHRLGGLLSKAAESKAGVFAGKALPVARVIAWADITRLANEARMPVVDLATSLQEKGFDIEPPPGYQAGDTARPEEQ